MSDEFTTVRLESVESQSPHKARWYALYCKSRHEKKVALQLDEKNITHYLPLKQEVRQWSDRKKKVELPLFKGYVFVYIPASHQISVLETYGAVAFVKFGGKMVPIRDEQIDAVRVLEKYGVGLRQETQSFDVNDRVRVTAGPCKGLEGYLLHKKNASRFVVGIDSLKLMASVEIEREYLENLSANI